jgi:hypothetical protein
MRHRIGERKRVPAKEGDVIEEKRSRASVACLGNKNCTNAGHKTRCP